LSKDPNFIYNFSVYKKRGTRPEKGYKAQFLPKLLSVLPPLSLV